MDRTINNGTFESPQAATGRGNARHKTPSDANRAAAAADNGKLTDSAQAQQETIRKDDRAVIDSKKVEQVRLALANGTYQINRGCIADRMLSLDAQIAALAATDKS